MSVRDTPESKRRHGKAWRERNRQRLRDASRVQRLAVRKEALDRYGRTCRRCGFADDRALQIDHVNDNGAAERKSLGGQHVSGWRFYCWLKKQGWPEGYQTLCANCNAIKQVEHRGNGNVEERPSSPDCHSGDYRGFDSRRCRQIPAAAAQEEQVPGGAGVKGQV